MDTTRTLTAMFEAVLVAAALSAQTPASEIDAVMTECAMASKLRAGAK